MDSASHQKIVGYFIEEAREHLENLEKGILELSSAIEDPERINELFRAAHSLKGGAAMLGFNSIQKTAHRLEDAFKILRENEVEVDQRLESLFLQGYDVLQNLIERLESPYGLQDDEAEAIMEEAQPTFVELQQYMSHLLGDKTPASDEIEIKKVEIPTPVAKQPASVSTNSSFNSQVKKLLKQMLELFKEKETGDGRQKLQEICVSLAKLSPQEPEWQRLVKSCQNAIANPKYSFHLLAPVVIKELKKGSDCIELGKGKEIAPSQSLQQLAAARAPQILVPLDPKAAANSLLRVFSKQQISELIQFLKSGI